MKKTIGILMCISILCFCSWAIAETMSASEAPTYGEYIQEYAQAALPSVSIPLLSEKLVKIQGAEVENGAIRFNGEQSEVSWRIQTEEPGLYCLHMAYLPLVSKHNQVEFALTIDGVTPFVQAGQFSLPRTWRDATAIREDSRGNQIRPSQEQCEFPQALYLYDPEGLRNAPLQFYLAAGEHTISLAVTRTDFVLNALTFEQVPPVPEYEHPQAAENMEKAAPIKIEGEHAVLKSDSTLYPITDRSNPATSPSHPTMMLLNTIGGSNWKDAFDWIEWSFSVPENGYYNISVRARQNLQSGVSANRRVYVDGMVPYAALENVSFPFSNDWYQLTFGGDSPCAIYLEAGEHTIRMENVPGPMGDLISDMQRVVRQLNDQYRRIVMVTGVTPDPYRDYQIYRDIPTLLDEMQAVADQMVYLKDQMSRYANGTSDSSGIMGTIIAQLQSFVDKPDTIPLRLSSMKANISSLSAWLLALGEQPLEIDYFYVAPAGHMPKMAKSNFITQLFYDLSCVVGSFGSDYRMVGDFTEEEDAISVWVSMGRDQVQIIKDLVDNDFVPKYGVKVNINLVQQGLIEATLAGKGPDVALFVGAAEPVNLAARGALVDLSAYPGYEEVISRFHEEAMVPFSYEGGSYALPITQTFPMMFYRKDIFKELGAEPPTTWEDVYALLPILQRNSLEMGIGSDISTFATLLFQQNGQFYNEQRTRTDFYSDAAMLAFSQWTDFFTKYDLPLSYDFLNRFRTGEMPIGIAPYTMFNVLQVTAPEIKGMWEMLPVPGTAYPDGTVNSNVCGGAQIQGAIIFQKTENKAAAWDFLDWFTSTDIQAQFGTALEAQLGASGRFATANMEALKYLPWSKAQQDTLYEQWKNVREIPEIPASYYISRNLINAFRAVKYEYANPRHTLNLYNEEMNQEILRKREEFGLTNE